MNYFFRLSFFAFVSFNLFLPTSYAALAVPRTATFTSSKGGHKVVVKAKSVPFDAKAAGAKKEYIGTDGGKPTTQFESILVSLDGKEIPVNKKWYEDLYNPNITPETFKVALGDDLKTVWAYMSGSDAAGSYGVLWVFPVIGPPSRLVSRSSDSNLCDPSIFEEASKGTFSEVK